MKKIIFIIACLSLLNSVYATHSLKYYVYFETEYYQGPWKSQNKLKINQKYLEPIAFVDNFGTVPEQLVDKIISRLKEKSPNDYNWNYKLTIQSDTVLLLSETNIAENEKLLNELVSSLYFNGFSSIIFQSGGIENNMSLSDLTIPYFDLTAETELNRIEEKKDTSLKQDTTQTTTLTRPVPDKAGNSGYWFMASLGINLLLILGIIYLLNKRGKTT